MYHHTKDGRWCQGKLLTLSLKNHLLHSNKNSKLNNKNLMTAPPTKTIFVSCNNSKTTNVNLTHININTVPKKVETHFKMILLKSMGVLHRQYKVQITIGTYSQVLHMIKQPLDPWRQSIKGVVILKVECIKVQVDLVSSKEALIWTKSF